MQDFFSDVMNLDNNNIDKLHADNDNVCDSITIAIETIEKIKQKHFSISNFVLRHNNLHFTKSFQKDNMPPPPQEFKG